MVDKSLLTGSNALVGLVFGVVFGVAMSFVMMRFRVFDQIVTPLAVALNAVPIVVLVPVLNNMLFGTTSQVPRRLMVALIVFFVVLVNVSKGLRQVDQTHIELMKSYAASPTEILRKVRIPNALPYLFTALKISAPLAVITAFVSEYFGAAHRTVSPNAVTNSLNGSKDVTWAYVIGASTLGLTFYLVSIALEERDGESEQNSLNTTQPHNRGAHMRKQFTRIVAGVAAASLVAAACGSDEASDVVDDVEGAAEDAADDAEAVADDVADEVDEAMEDEAMEDDAMEDDAMEDGDGGGTAAADCAETESVSLQLQWFTQAQFAGYYARDRPGLLRRPVLGGRDQGRRRRDRAAIRTRQRQRGLRHRMGAQGAADT